MQTRSGHGSGVSLVGHVMTTHLMASRLAAFISLRDGSLRGCIFPWEQTLRDQYRACLVTVYITQSEGNRNEGFNVCVRALRACVRACVRESK